MNNAEKRNIRDQLYLMESNLNGLAININTLYGFIGKDVRVSIKKEDFGFIDKTVKEPPKDVDKDSVKMVDVLEVKKT